MTARALPILMYHHVSPHPGLVTISPENFSAQMAWLANNGYHTASCKDLEHFLAGGSLPTKSVMLTFDDGYLDNYIHAYPVLRQHGLHAVVFVVTDWPQDGATRPTAGEANIPQLLDHRDCAARIKEEHPDDAIMRWSEIEKTLKEGIFEFHSHTATHTRWDKACINAKAKSDALAQDIARSQETLRERLGQASSHLCWPQGYFDTDYQSVAHEQGFRYLYTTQPGTVCPDSATANLPRIVVKDKNAAWLSSRIRLYSSPTLARWYGRLKGN